MGEHSARDECSGRARLVIADRAGHDADAVGRGDGHCKTGRDAGWKAQRRDDGSIPFRVVARRHRTHTFCGVASRSRPMPCRRCYWPGWPRSCSVSSWPFPCPPSPDGKPWARLRRRIDYGASRRNRPRRCCGVRTSCTCEWTTARPQMTDALARLAGDAQLRALHAMMLPTTHERRRGEYDVDLLGTRQARRR